MSEKKAPGDAPAFPVTAGNQVYATGMSLRDWFAGQALAGIMAGYWGNPEMSGLGPQQLAEEAVAAADAMLAARTEAAP